MAYLKDTIINGVLRVLSKVYAPEFVGKLTGNADSATTLNGLTASINELNYMDGVTSNVQTQIDAVKKSASDGKSSIASAITNQGVTTSADDTYKVSLKTSFNTKLRHINLLAMALR